MKKVFAPLTSDFLQVYVESYHQAVAGRLKSITDNQLEITDIYSLLDWLHNIYKRYRDTRVIVFLSLEFSLFFV